MNAYERRNLLTHAGGIVSKKYLDACKNNGFDVSGVKEGDRVIVGLGYFKSAVQKIYEVGIKICHQFWIKYSENQEEAGWALNALCLDLIYRGAYRIAESLLLHGVETLADGNARLHRTLVVNLANSIRLQKRTDEAKTLLDRYDWSASSQRFQLCVAAVKGDLKLVIQCMKSIGPNSEEIAAENYRSWPVFIGVREELGFSTAFEEIFNEPLIKTKHETMLVESNSETSEGSPSPPSPADAQ